MPDILHILPSRETYGLTPSQMADIQLAGKGTHGPLSHHLPLLGSVSYPASDAYVEYTQLITVYRTILITVLTNSFMTIASNATEEHQ